MSETTTVVQEQKGKRRKKKTQLSLDDIFDWARRELYKAAELFTKRKSDIILETAKKLEETGIEPHKISTEIAKGLEGFVDHSWVNKVLKDYPQYKEEHRVNNVKKRKSSRINPTEQAQTETTEDAESGAENRATAESTGTVITVQGKQEQEPQQEEDDSPFGSYQMPIEQYNINDVEQYDRKFLIQLVQYLHKQVEELRS